MNRADFEALVAKMEQTAKARPQWYPWRVAGWAAMGYGFLLLVIGTLLALCIGAIVLLQRHAWLAAKLLFIFVPAAYVVGRSVWVKFSPPEGERVTRADAPALFDMIDALSRDLRTPRIHVVVITPELNAAVVQSPRLGFLGWHRNYLLLGLPLMKGLSVEQFRAVLAHELGHLSRGHARMGNYVYRLRRIWSNLERAYEAEARVGAGVIRKFFAWYVPRFNAVSFPLARANEFEADAAAARMTSPQAAAQALTGISVLARYMEQKFWPDIHAAAKDQSAPAFAPYSRFVGGEVLEVPDAARAGWLQDALSRQTTCDDTHPSLRDRLQAIGGDPSFAPPSQGQGAETLLGDALDRLQQEFDEQWRRDVGPSWTDFHERLQHARTRLAELRAAPPLEADAVDPLLEIADLEERVGDGAESALTWRRRATDRFPDSVVARFVLARHLLQSANPEGLSVMESLVEDATCAQAGAEVLRDYHWRRGDKEAAQRWQDRLLREAEEDEAARREREAIHTSDQYSCHDLDEKDLATIVAKLRDIPAVRRAYLVRKRMRHRLNAPLYVLGFSCTSRWRRADQHRTAEALEAIRTQVNFPGETMILSVAGDNRTFEPVFKRVPMSRVL